MDKDYEKKEPKLNQSMVPDGRQRETLIDQEEKVGDKVEVSSKLVDTSVGNLAEEPQTQQPTLPPTQEPTSESLPHVGDNVGDEEEKRRANEEAKRKAYLDQIKAEYKAYKEKQDRPNLAKDLYKQKREIEDWDIEPDEWSDAEVEAIKSIFPEISEYQYNRSNEELTQEIQDLLNNPDNVIYGKTKLGRNIRNRLVDKTMQQSYGNLGWCNDFLNELSTLRRLYATATYSENPEVKKRAIKRINQIEETTNTRLNGMTDEEKAQLKNYMLLTEYAQTYENIKNYPDNQDIWILAREADQPIVAIKPMEGAYKTTIGKFKSDMYRLATNRGDVALPSGITKTRKRPNDVDLYSVDFDAFFNPYRYVEINKEKQNQLAKEGLSRYFDMTRPDYTPITESMDKNTYMLIEAIKSNKELTEAQKQAEIEKIRKEAEEKINKANRERDKARQDASRAEQELKDEYEIQETMRANAEEEKRKEYYKKEEARQARVATSAPMEFIKNQVKVDYAKEREGATKGINALLSLYALAGEGEKAILKQMEEALKDYSYELDRAEKMAPSGSWDEYMAPQSINKLLDLAKKHPNLTRAIKALKFAPYVGLALTAYDIGKNYYDKWQDKEEFYRDLHNTKRFNDYFDKAFESYPNGKASYLERMDTPHDFKALFKLQISDNVPKYKTQTQTSDYVYPNREEINEIYSDLRKQEMDIIHKAAGGYGEKYTRASTRDWQNPYKSSKGDVIDMLGLKNLKNPQDSEIKMLKQYPWMLPFMQSFHNTSTPEIRKDVYKRILKQWKPYFSEYSY